MTKKSVKVFPAVMKWARTTFMAGKLKEEAARMLKLSVEELDKLESQENEITVPQLNKLSEKYHRPVTVLMLKTPPKSMEPPKFRKIDNFEELEFDKKTFAAIRQAQEIQNRAEFLFEEKTNEFLLSLKRNSDSVDNLVKIILKELRIDEKVRFEGKDSKGQFKIWKRLLETKSVIVLIHKFPLSDTRAFTLYNKIAPVIVLNNSDSDNGMVFSLFHELTHLALGHTDFDYEMDLGAKQKKYDEYFCNQVAAQCLVPKDLLINVIGMRNKFDEDLVQDLAYKFKVSKSVIWIRLKEIGLIGEAEIRKVRNTLSKFEGYNKKERKPSGGGKNTHLYVTLNRKSEFFISEVFAAYNLRRISYFDVLDYIGITSNTLPKLQKLIYT
ncbi:MAG: ImmA/IrrE family metallo-endopeptidase [Candidatus Daviesbacteria bacterium]|nr:ImmA/IrrE family metallo-endopeptidase [Candidatus Daviesbacteria bacterium]